MNILEIRDRDSLEKYLSNDWFHISRSIAYRAALRSLPALRTVNKYWLANEAIMLFRALLITSLKLDDYYQDIAQSVDRALVRITDPGFAPNEVVYGPARLSVTAALKTVMYENPAIASAASDAAAQSAILFGERAWAAIRDDCALIQDFESRFGPHEMANAMGSFRLWEQPWPATWLPAWAEARELLFEVNPNFIIWSHWVERRLIGETSAFDIFGDKGRVEDKKILRRLAEATDEDFWGKGHEYVNATLKSWLYEARQRVAPVGHHELQATSVSVGPPGGSHPVLGIAGGVREPTPLPIQNASALSFRTDAEGRITIDTAAMADHLRTDAGARDRHEEAVNEARNALHRCQGNNAAARLTGLLTNYLLAAGENLEAAKPSLLVQRGERLRQELARYEAPDHMLPPVADDLLLDLNGWQSAHNMMVGLDPVLMASDTAILGPDRQPLIIPINEIRDRIVDADKMELLADGNIEILLETIALVPSDALPDDRQARSASEMMQNLVIEASAFVANHIAFTGGSILAWTQVGFLEGAMTLGAAVTAGHYLLKHREFIEERLNNWPAFNTVFERIADWLETVLPPSKG